VDGPPREHRSAMAQLSGARPRPLQHVVTEGQQVLRDPRGGVGEKRQNVDFGIPEIVPLIRLAGEALRGHPRSFRTRGCLQDVEEVETDRLLDLNRGALCAFWPDL